MITWPVGVSWGSTATLIGRRADERRDRGLAELIGSRLPLASTLSVLS